jgi:hypothetical protein
MSDNNREERSEPAASKPPARRSTTYPRNSLREAEEFARKVFDLGARDVAQDNAAKAIGYSGANNGSYKRFRAAARYFGLVDYSGDEFISVTPQWVQAFLAGDAESLQRARQYAVRKPELYRQLVERYGGKQLPPSAKVAQVLFADPQYGITKDAAAKAAEVFLESVGYAGVLDSTGHLRLPGLPAAFGDEGDGAEADQDAPIAKPSESQLEERGQLAMPGVAETKVERSFVLQGGERLAGLPDRKGDDPAQRGAVQRILADLVWPTEAAKRSWPVVIKEVGCEFYFDPAKPLPKGIREAIKLMLDTAPERQVDQ